MVYLKNSKKEKNNVIIIGGKSSGTMRKEFLKPISLDSMIEHTQDMKVPKQ